MFFRKGNNKKKSLPEFKPFGLLPNELQNKIINYLPIKEAGRAALVSKSFHLLMNQNARLESIYDGQKILNEKQSDTPNKTKEINELFAHFNKKYSIQFFNMIDSAIPNNYYFLHTIHKNFSSLINGFDNENEKEFSLARLRQNAAHALSRAEKILELSNTPAGLKILGKNLIPIEAIFDFEPESLKILFTKEGYIALRTPFINLTQVKMLSPEELGIFLSQNGITALKNNAMNFDQFCEIAARTLDLLKIRLLISPLGLIALKENLITPDNARLIPHGILDLLITENGIQALRERLITVAQALDLGYGRLNILFNNTKNSLRILKHQLTIEEFKKTQLKYCMSKLRHLDQANEFNFTNAAPPRMPRP